ncbi:DUF4270 family protein [Tenacibaculum pacificus]|uniref:DUF4270 family protein n=1 Tax=Tenacibaculum pacificus TaxID=3018314 RepID=UPI0022F3F18C|nr:DUF4270 family protein [Tenacibaculum pacificus]WBX73553.1 DUF4270 family protein [Tenacibaculum pacificus]
MIRKIGVLGISLLCLATIISCEKDFNDVGGRVIDNTKFETGELLLDVAIEKIDISDSNTNDAYKAVRADNISTTVGEYWLGVYKNGGYKGIEASIISQLKLLNNPKIKDTKPATKIGEIDSIYVLDKVILKIPYTATNIGKETDGKPKFRLDSILGDISIPMPLNIYRNGTYLSELNPSNPANQNSFQSNHSYIKSELLNENTGFTFKPSPKDTMLILTRNISNGNTYKDTIKLANKAPFLTIPLDKEKMKTIFWDKFKDTEFSSSSTFNNYFRGLIIETEGSNGTIFPLSLLGTNASVSVDFLYTITTFQKKEGEATLVLKDTLPNTYSFPLSGIRNSKYVMSPATTAVPSNNFVIQGTAGTMAKVTILNESKLQELRDDKLLINDASLTFYVNQNINTNKNIVPQKLFIYQNIDKGTKGIVPTQLTDAYKETATFGGYIQLSEDDKPEKYSFSIKDYISDLLDGTTSDIEPLILKVYNNPTDSAIKNNAIDVNVRTYNWNPRGVTLLNGSETANGVKRAVLKISYSKEK